MVTKNGQPTWTGCLTSDQRTRAAQRQGDRVAWLTERMRAGTLTREAVDLAAYCGDPAARVGNPHYAFKPVTYRKLDDWVADLDRWPGALERAALAACEVWLGVDPHAYPNAKRLQREALQAARAHIEAPSEATREACATLWATSSLDLPTTRLCGGLDGVHSPSWPVVVVTEAARLSDPAAVRAGICRALIEWTLG